MKDCKIFLLVTMLTIFTIFSGIAEAGIVTDRVPIQCYVDRRVSSYNQPGGNAIGWIDANVDLVQVLEIRGDGWARGTHPSGKNKRVERWFRIADLCADPGYSNRGVKVSGKHIVYRTRNSNVQFGSVTNEDVIVLAEVGNRAQIIYNVSGGYKIGWIASSAIPSRGRTLPQKPTNPMIQPVSRYATVNNGWYKISSCRAPYRVLDVWGGGNRTDNGLQIQLWDWGNGNNQKFYVENLGNNYFALKVGFCNKYVAAENSSGNLRTRVVLMDKNVNSATQQWRLVNAGNGSYYIESKIREKLAFDPKDAGNANEVPIQLWEYGNVEWNKWKFDPVEAPSGNWDSKVGQSISTNSEAYRSQNPFYNAGYSGQCTWYAWGRMKELTGKSITFNGSSTAKLWKDNASNCSPCELQSQCIAVRIHGGWNKAHTYENGHVVFVEHIEGNNVYYSQDNWTSSTNRRIIKDTISHFKQLYQYFIK